MRSFTLHLLLAFSGLSLLGATTLHAAEPLGFPKDNPAFTFELPNGMQSQYTPEGTLVCTGQADGLSVKGVFQALPNIHDERGARMGLSRLVRLIGPRSINTDLRYPDPFDQKTTSGVPTMTYSAIGRQNGVDYAIAFIVFTKGGKFYELIASGSTTAMQKLNFPHSFRESMKLTP